MEIVKVYETEFYHFNVLRAAAGTTGLRGGAAKEGGRTFIEIEDLGGTEIHVAVIEPGPRGNGGVKLELGGDAELRTIIQAFRFIADTLARELRASEIAAEGSPLDHVPSVIETVGGDAP